MRVTRTTIYRVYIQIHLRYTCIYVIYIYVCVCFVCAAFFKLFIVWVFCEKHKSLRKSTMVNGEGGTWALGGGQLTGLSAKWKYCALLLLLLLDISCHSIKTVKMTKLWSACVWAKCVWQSDATPGQEHRLHMTHPLCECCITRERRDSEEIWIRFDFCVKVIRFKAVGGSEGSEV